METKKCTICGSDLPVSEFAHHPKAAVETAEKEIIQKAILMFSQVYDMRSELSKKEAVDMFERILTQ